MKEIKVLKAYKDHKEFIIHANNIINIALIIVFVHIIGKQN